MRTNKMLAGEEMEYTVGLLEISLGVILFGVLQFIASLWISERLKVSLQKEHSTFLEDLKWEQKTREQAVRVAEYLALARSLKENSPVSDYCKANQMSWELAMWLPEEIYKQMVGSIVSPSESTNELTTVVSVRKLLLKEKSGKLSSENIAHHGPGISKKTC
ncbi:hypothetical protein [Shewanella sp. SE1]|uniref:hypothetical protein n=1 Tax=Shewanella sp. SE1 TaxID=2705014 RepID=UPI00138F91BE|nr:hypothetical protein [Shewanella sp. SE1]NDO76173.1 hypothetical protein [Shewanella sp. SE1]